MVVFEPFLVGGFNPSEKYESNRKSSLNRGENKKYLKQPPRFVFQWIFFVDHPYSGLNTTHQIYRWWQSPSGIRNISQTHSMFGQGDETGKYFNDTFAPLESIIRKKFQKIHRNITTQHDLCFLASNTGTGRYWNMNLLMCQRTTEHH